MHRLGYRSGIYSSSLSGVADLSGDFGVPGYAMPDRDYMDVQLASGPARTVRGRWAWAPGGLRFAQLAAMNGTTWFRLHNPPVSR